MRQLRFRLAWPCLAVLGRACLAIKLGQRQGAPSAVLADCPPTRPGAIPKVVWYTHRNTNCVPKLFESNLRERNPGFTLQFYNESMIEDFLQESYGPEHVQAFRSLPSGANRADLFRYAVLFKKGGYYIDVDNEALVPLENISGPNAFVSVISTRDPNGVHIHNGFIASVPGNPIMGNLLSHIVQHVKVEPSYPLYKYHYYVRYFFEVLNVSLPPAGLAPWTEYNFMGLRASFLYQEWPNVNIYDRTGAPMMLMGHHVSPAEWAPAPLPKYVNLVTREWWPWPDSFHTNGHAVSPLANLSRCGPAAPFVAI